MLLMGHLHMRGMKRGLHSSFKTLEKGGRPEVLDETFHLFPERRKCHSTIRRHNSRGGLYQQAGGRGLRSLQLHTHTGRQTSLTSLSLKDTHVPGILKQTCPERYGQPYADLFAL